VLAILGPTASGKSEVAMAVCQALGGELVSCDSVQVYRGFRIGCAKPTAEEQARVHHHLIDIVDWHEGFDARRFRELAGAAIDDIRARGRVPVVCGGTGLYLRVLRWGLVDAPAADEALRARLFAEEAEQPGVLYGRLLRDDPDTAARTEPKNLVHIVRALEIQQKTGEPASRVRDRHRFATEVLPMRALVLQWPPEVLKSRIERRSGRMLEAGLLEEVRDLLDAGVSPDCRPMRSVGYREACAVVCGEAPAAGLAERIGRSTWAYARRQRTWLRRECDVEPVEVRALPDAIADVLDRTSVPR
jgi:tRNA dimethylallyltransferase